MKNEILIQAKKFLNINFSQKNASQNPSVNFEIVSVQNMNIHLGDYVFEMNKDIQDKLRANFDPDKQNQIQSQLSLIMS